jgi:tetratricopeptide (TPR) repeat protein
MVRKIWPVLGAFAVLLAASSEAQAQLQGGADWDATAKRLGSTQLGDQPATTSLAPAARNATIDQLNRILSTPQLSGPDRSAYLSIRAFVFSRLGREADSQKDVAEMARANPQGWPMIMSILMPGLAGGGDRAAALRALNYGLQRKPDDVWLLIGQAQVLMQLADYGQAMSSVDRAANGASSGAERRIATYNRGQANFNLGNFQQSADDFDVALVGLTSAKSRLDGVLWRYAAQVHTRHDARAILRKDIGNENLYEWPGPIAKFLLGKLPSGELEVAAESDQTAKASNGKCPAAFYMGMEAQRRGDKVRAREQLQLAQARCPTVSPYNWAASSELKRL